MKKNFSNSFIFQSLVNDTCNISDSTNDIDEEVNSNYSFIILKDNKKTWSSANFLLEIGNINELRIKKENYLLE